MTLLAETFEVDISNTKQLLEGKRGDLIRQRDVIVSIFVIIIPVLCFTCIYLYAYVSAHTCMHEWGFLCRLVILGVAYTNLWLTELIEPAPCLVGCWGIWTLHTWWHCVCAECWSQGGSPSLHFFFIFFPLWTISLKPDLLNMVPWNCIAGSMLAYPLGKFVRMSSFSIGVFCFSTAWHRWLLGPSDKRIRCMLTIIESIFLFHVH